MDECLQLGITQSKSRWTRNYSGTPSQVAQGYADRINQLFSRLNLKQPLTGLQRQLLSAASYVKQKEWVVKEADKNLGLVLLSKRKYLELLNKELGDSAFENAEFRIEELLRRLHRICERSKLNTDTTRLIMDKAAQYRDPKKFYVLPKIHKPTIKSRPITAQHSYVFSQLSRDLGNLLNKEVKKVPTITINSRQFINQMERISLKPDVWFLTYDVERMYPSMNILDTVTTLRNAFPGIFRWQHGFWFHILALLLPKTFITAEGVTKRQVTGIATGSPAAPTIANLYLWLKYREVFQRFNSSVILNRRYIDDGFVVTRSKDACETLARALNEATNLDIEWTISDREAIYLDIRIFKGPRFQTSNIVDVEIYTKPISKFLYLHATSSHPKHVFSGIVKGELIRYLRNTSNRAWIRKISGLFKMLKRRGYTNRCLNLALQSIHYKDRAKHMSASTTVKPPMEDTIIVPYNPDVRKA